MIAPDSIIKDLNKIGRSEAIERLHNLYTVADNKKTRMRILEILNDLKDNSHFKEIENYFISDEDPDVRMEAAKLLAFNYNKKKAIKPLIWVIENEKKPDVKYTALNLLVPLAERKEFRRTIIESLKKALTSNDDRLKMYAAESLGYLNETSSANILLEMLNSSSKLVRIRVIQALGNLRNKRAIFPLIENLGLGSFDVWEYALDALKKIVNNETLIELLLQALEDTAENNNKIDIGYLRRGIIKALGELGNERAIALLINALKDWYDWVREEAILALDKIEPDWQRKYISLLKRKNINFKK
ncbi:MAG: HEAT repeat domain-containing protein [Candidatus Thorarchaeota archaeon]